jgi:hypothetical protein
MIGNSQTRRKFREGIGVGDVFCERLAHWKVVYRVSGVGEIYTLETRGTVVLEMKTYVSESTLEKSLSYQGIDGYWCDYYGNDRKRLEQYLERYFNQEKFTKEQIREFKLENLIEI